MKKKHLILFSFALSFLLVGTLFTGCSKKNDSPLTKVKLNEVTRSIFYAPMYAAIDQGFFKAEGLEIELSTGGGADKTMQQLLSGNVDIGFSGPEQVLYVYNQQRENYPIAFAQLTQKDGSFLVSRTVENNFSWESLKGKTIIGGRPGGVPEMALEYVLKNHGIDKNKDIKLITNIAFETVPAAFKGGTGDYAAIFEPTASTIVKAQGGSLAASVGAAAGDLPYTCFYTTKNYMDKNSDIIDKFTRAIYKGQLWVQKNSNEDIAKSIKSFFPGTDEALIVQVVKNYKDIDAYAKDPVLKEENLNRLMDIIQSYDANLLKTRPEYSKVVNNTFADKAIKNIK